jgi:hypothetical protein
LMKPSKPLEQRLHRDIRSRSLSVRRTDGQIKPRPIEKTDVTK